MDLTPVFLKIQTCQFLAVTSDFRYILLKNGRTKKARSYQNSNGENKKKK